MFVVSRFRFCFALAVFVPVFFGLVHADDEKEEAAGDDSEETTTESVDSIGPKFQGLSLLSEGKPSYGVRIPSFEDDVLVSLTDIEVLTKLADGNLLIEKMVFTQFDEDQEVSMVVEVELGIYNTEDERLTSTHQTVIHGDGFHAVGEGCVFRQGSSVVELTGIVHSKFSGDRNPVSAHQDPKVKEESEKENSPEPE